MRFLAHIVLFLAVAFGTLYAGWVGLQALGREPQAFAADGFAVALPPELDVGIQRLPRVPDATEAAFGADSDLVRPMATVAVTVTELGEGDDLDVAIVDGRSGAEITRWAAATELELAPIPAGAHWLALVPRGLSARRSYVSRTPLETVAGRHAVRTLSAARGSLRLAIPAGIEPPIAELVRPEDPDWRAEAHAGSTARSDGTLQVVFPALGHGRYLVYLHDGDREPRPIPVVIDGDVDLPLVQ